MKTYRGWVLMIVMLLGVDVFGAGATQAAGHYFVYFGTFTGAKSQGIYVSRLDVHSGQVSAPELAVETKSPSFLAIHPNQKFLYAVGEAGVFDGKKTGAVNAFAIHPQSGKLTLLNRESAGGPGTCFVGVDQAGKHVLVANYAGGSVAVLPIKTDGSLGAATAFVQHSGSSVNPQRQKEPHAHSIFLDAANRFALAADLGLDKVLIYRFDKVTGTLTPNDPPCAKLAPGAGPRHLDFHPNGRFVYVINELLCTVTAFRYDAERGALTELQTISTLPVGQAVQTNFSTAEVRVHPSGKFLYGSNRGHDSIAIFAIAPDTGLLTAVGHQSTQGQTPRNFNFDPTGAFLLAANQGSDSVVVFRLDSATGGLTPTGQTLQIGAPVCVKFMPCANP